MPLLYHSRSVVVPSLQIILIFFASKICASPEAFFLRCSNNTYTSASSYSTSLHILLTYLTEKVAYSPNLYIYSDAQAIFRTSLAYGLAQCRPDSHALSCSACLNQTATLATASLASGGCGRSVSVALRLDQCLLLYSDHSNLTFPEWNGYESFSNSPVTDPGLRDRLKILVDQNARDAATASSRFAVASVIITVSSQNDSVVYLMSWCRLDPLSDNCTQCLQSANDKLNVDRKSAHVVKLSCYVRFGLDPFFFSNSLISPPPLFKDVFGSGDKLTATFGEGEGRKMDRILIISISEAVAFFLVCIISVLCWLRLKKNLTVFSIKDSLNKENIRIDHFVFHDLGNIRAATGNFSEVNKLGEGGFGAVYKGVLRDGQEVAVKRLSKSSVQGVEELKNEVAFVAKLQHRNLVRLLGSFLDNEEKLLFYEFLPNKSLDRFLFDPKRRATLDWGTRYKIIEGVAQGLLYLHEDSRLRVIHCDLKASNILLDCSMNPKISDFGFAKLFGINEAQRKTSQIAGTQGYMAPEYAMRGLFSTKSDVYSYGVLVLETITGRRGVCLDESEDSLDLQSFVGKNWKKGQAMQSVDPSLGDRYMPEQVLRCIQIGLLCIQQDPAQRPSMASLVVMLGTSNAVLPEPLLPSFLR